MTRRRNPAPRRGGGSDGFLLAETLITLALSALVLVGLVSSAAVLLRATDRSVATVGSADELGRTLAALNRDIAGLRRARWSGDEPQTFVFRGGPNSLSFAQDVPAPDGGSEMRVVSLREIDTGRGTALMRAEARLPATAADWGALRFGPARAVPTGPARLRFRYVAERVASAPAPKPVDRWTSGRTLPAAVIVEAVDAATTRLIVTDTIAVRTDADIGCADRTPPRRDAPVPGAPGAAAAQQAVASGAVQTPQQQGPTPGMSVDVAGDVANANEFCGRADKGIAPKPPGQQFLGQQSLGQQSLGQQLPGQASGQPGSLAATTPFGTPP